MLSIGVRTTAVPHAATSLRVATSSKEMGRVSTCEGRGTVQTSEVARALDRGAHAFGRGVKRRVTD
eukprot:4775569-Pleurochrysis_carterae.AAC.2